MNMVRSIHHDKKFPDDYWVETILIAIFVFKISLTTSFQNVVPQEAWDGKKVNVSHFQIFG